jgi:hypothetical protein
LDDDERVDLQIDYLGLAKTDSTLHQDGSNLVVFALRLEKKICATNRFNLYDLCPDINIFAHVT